MKIKKIKPNKPHLEINELIGKIVTVNYLEGIITKITDKYFFIKCTNHLCLRDFNWKYGKTYLVPIGKFIIEIEEDDEYELDEDE